MRTLALTPPYARRRTQVESQIKGTLTLSNRKEQCHLAQRLTCFPARSPRLQQGAGFGAAGGVYAARGIRHGGIGASYSPSTLACADTSWSDARSALMVEAKRPLKAQLTAEIAKADEAEHEAIRAAFASREAALEHDLDHKPLTVDLEMSVSYNFLSK